jgi:hypothetical protein
VREADLAACRATPLAADIADEQAAEAGQSLRVGASGSILFDREGDKQCGSSSDGARDFDCPSECVDAVGEAYESGTACRIGPSAAIVADRERKDTVTRFDRDVRRGSVRVLRDIRERF